MRVIVHSMSETIHKDSCIKTCQTTWSIKTQKMNIKKRKGLSNLPGYKLEYFQYLLITGDSSFHLTRKFYVLFKP